MAETESFVVTTTPANLKAASPAGLGLDEGTAYYVQSDSAIPVRLGAFTSAPDRGATGVHTIPAYGGADIEPGSEGLWVWTKSGRAIIAVTESP